MRKFKPLTKDLMVAATLLACVVILVITYFGKPTRPPIKAYQYRVVVAGIVAGT